MKKHILLSFCALMIVSPALAQRAATTPGAAPRTITIPAAPMLPYHAVAAPVLPPDMKAGGVAGITLTRDGTLYSFERTATPLVEWKTDAFVVGYLQNTIKRAHALRVDPDGVDLWLCDVQANIVEKVSPDGKVLLTLGTAGEAGTWDADHHLFNQPTDIGFGPNGDLYVTTGHGGDDPRVVHFDKSGNFINTWDLKHADGSAPFIHSVVVDKTGLVYVADRDAMVLRIYDAMGQHLRDVQMTNLISSLYIDPQGGLWMTAGQDGMVMKLDWNGKTTGWFGKLGKGLGEFAEAHYMVMTPDLKTIYIADTDNSRITKYVRNAP